MVADTLCVLSPCICPGFIHFMDTFLTLSNVSIAVSVLITEPSGALIGISTTAESKKHGKFVHNKKVQGVNLKSFLEANYMEWVNKLSFIKIDTEGYDKEILKSISDLLQKYKPVVIAESFGKASDADKMELFDVIVNNGYDIYYFEDFDINLKVEKFKSHFDMIRFRSNINIYATPININS